MRFCVVVSIALSFSATLVVAAAPSLLHRDHYAVHEARSQTSPRWMKRDRVPGTKILPVRIGLTQNLERAEEHLLDVSHPHSPNYGRHWTAEQVIEAFKPSDTAVQAVKDWLAAHGITQGVVQSENKAWLAFDAPASKVESLLYTEYYEFEDGKTGGVLPACDEYHVPSIIQEHIDYITPGIKLMGPVGGHAAVGDEHKRRRMNARRSVDQQQARNPFHRPKREAVELLQQRQLASSNDSLSTCDAVITPACIAALYKIPPGSLADPSNSFGLFETELQAWDQQDLDSFFSHFAPQIPDGTHPLNIEIDGGVAMTTNVSAAGREIMLDLAMAYPIVYPQTITSWNVDDIHYQRWRNDTYNWGYNSFLDAIDGSYCTYTAYNETGNAPGIDPTYPDPQPDRSGYNGVLQCGGYKPPNVVSFSYQGQEVHVPIAYQKRQCNEFLKLGLQGVSLIFGSGDGGIASYPEPYGDDGPTGCLGPGFNIFNPSWPSNCPYVTSVGATKVYPGFTVFDNESTAYVPEGDVYAVNYSSGGGFSNVYGVPSYQADAVATYLADHNPQYAHYSGLVPDKPNPALPDVAALAGDTGGVYNRIGRGYPDVAANGDNSATYTRGKFVLGGGTSASTPIFAAIINRLNEERIAVNKTPVGFLNPVLYKNPQVFNDIVNGSNPGCTTPGFSAAEGWDPNTGLGTPNYSKMLELFLSLP